MYGARHPAMCASVRRGFRRSCGLARIVVAPRSILQCSGGLSSSSPSTAADAFVLRPWVDAMVQTRLRPPHRSGAAFIIFGAPGAGKPALASHLASVLRGRLLACSAGQSAVEFAAAFLDLLGAPNTTPNDVDAAVHAIHAQLNVRSDVVVVVDALDEGVGRGAEVLLRLLERGLPASVRVLATSRPVGEIAGRAEAARVPRMTLEVDGARMAAEDVRRYVQEQVDGAIFWQEEHFRRSFVDAVAAAAGSNYLLAEMLLRHHPTGPGFPPARCRPPSRSSTPTCSRGTWPGGRWTAARSNLCSAHSLSRAKR